MKVTQTVFVHYDTTSTCEILEWSRWDLVRYEAENSKDQIFVGTAEVTFEVPDDFDPRPAQVKALEAKKRELQAQFSSAVIALNQQINSLLCIENATQEAA